MNGVSLYFGLAGLLVGILFIFFLLKRNRFNNKILKNLTSERKLLSEKIADLRHKLTNIEKVTVMRYVAASFAHEVGTPLNAVGMHLQLLQDDLNKIDPDTEFYRSSEKRIKIVIAQLKRIQKIVDHFLQNSSKPSFQVELVDLNEAIEESLEMVMPRIVALGVRIDLALDRKMQRVRGYPIEIEQILLNLFGNALDALKKKKERNPEAELHLEVKTSSKEESIGKVAEIEIRDTGVGMNKSEMIKVFDPFFTTKPAGQGTGIGLTICKEAIEKHGGRITIDSEENLYSKIKFWIPFERTQ